jgi:phytoene dehydrogenase-like protein
MSVYVQYTPYRLKTGSWKERSGEVGDATTRLIEEHALGFSSLVLGRQVLTPLDLEETYGLTGGHPSHGEPALDQLFVTRPLLGWARYRSPIAGLYLCSAGTHPGGGVTGGPGHNAASEIAKDLRRTRV